MTDHHVTSNIEPVGVRALPIEGGDSVLLDAGVTIRASGLDGNGFGVEAIYSEGLGHQLTLSGTVQSTHGVAIMLGGTSTIAVKAGGSVRGGSLGAIYLGLNEAAGASTITNRGTIEAESDTISSSRGFLTLVNSGTIISSEDYYAISCGGGGHITNTGSIVGRVGLAGNSVYDGRGGTVSGMISFGPGTNTAYGGDGAEAFGFFGGVGVVDGGGGVNTIYLVNALGGSQVDLSITGAQDTGGCILTIANIQNVVGRYGDDRLTGNGADNLLQGAGGGDLLDGGAGNDRLMGENDADTLIGGLGDDTLDGGANSFSQPENDTARYVGTVSAVVSLMLQGSAQDTGGYGFDTLIGIENLEGGDGGDTFTGDSLNNRLFGNGGIDQLSGGGGNDALDGGSGDDRLFGEAGEDLLIGGLGDDMLDGGTETGNGAARDIAKYAGSAAAVVSLRLQGQAQDTGGYGRDTLIGIEGLEGGDGDDIFTGDDRGNILIGNGGNDRLIGGKGYDFLDGGTGQNTAVFAGSRSIYTIQTFENDGRTTVFGSLDGVYEQNTLYNIRFVEFDDQTVVLKNEAPTGLNLSTLRVAEDAAPNRAVATLSATDADGDALTYTLEADVQGLFRIEGTQLILTRALDYETRTQHSITVKVSDPYDGEATASFTIEVTDVPDDPEPPPPPPPPPPPVSPTDLVLAGTSRADQLTGGAGNDRLSGKLGRDVLTGGAGQDVFVFDTRPNSRTNLDTLTDFSAADDSVWLDNKYLKKLGSGSASSPKKLKAAFFKAADKAKDGNDYLVYNKKTGILYYDADGSGAGQQVAIAKFANKPALTKDDFFII